MKIIKNKYIISSFVILSMFLHACFEREFEPNIVTYPPITITDFSPKVGRPTSEITIVGTNFGKDKIAAEISFNEIALDDEAILSYSDDSIVVRAPEDASSGPIKVRVFTNTAETSEEFTFLEGAVVDSLKPETTEIGGTVSVYGKRFGTNKETVQFFFFENVEAEVLTVTDEVITVKVPAGIRSGNATLIVDGQAVECPKFSIPVIGANFLFDTDGDAEGWTVSNSNGASFEVSNGQFNVTYGSVQGEDFELDANVSVLVGEFPILAIRMDGRPHDGKFTFETDLGMYQNKNNNWDGIINDNVYYYDLRKSFEFDQTIDPDVETVLKTFKWQISGATGQAGYSVDWVQTFQSVDDLRKLVKEETPAGYYVFEFDDEMQTEWNVGDQNPSYAGVKDGKLVVPVDNQGNYWVSRFQYSPASGEKWHYSTEYPIFAFKISIYDTEGKYLGYLPLNADGSSQRKNIKFRNRNDRGPSADYAEEYDGVLYWDFPNVNLGGSYAPTENAENDNWFIRIPSSYAFPSGADGQNPPGRIEVDWVRTFKTLEDLETFLQTQK